jgi:hypothetical protein
MHDPTLGPGWAYMVEKSEYIRAVSKGATQDEISHCAGFEALSMANSRRSKGLRATGVGSVSCSRHEHVRPTAIGDLQVGERYAEQLYV